MHGPRRGGVMHILCALFLISRSLSGGELFDRVAAEDYKMTEAEVIRYVRQVCEGLAYMHESNIVHLDIKVRVKLFNKSFCDSCTSSNTDWRCT